MLWTIRHLVGPLIFGLCAFITPVRAESDCAPPAVSRATLHRLDVISDYRPSFKLCLNTQGERFVALREMTAAGSDLLLLVDPTALTTRLSRAACWTCETADEAALTPTRLMRAINSAAASKGVERRTFLDGAGLNHGAGPGIYVTGDLCPSPRPLERDFLRSLEARGPHTPVALSISGLWLLKHYEDFRWILDERDRGALDVLWVDHSYHHPYRKGAPADETFMLTPGLNADAEILQTERLLIANGETPSLFFRFPGLISTSPLMQAVRRLHLVSLGADAWLALGKRASPGSIVLVHPNGNEPEGLRLFARAMDKGALPTPFEALVEAPR